MRGRRTKDNTSFRDRLAAVATDARRKAALLPPGEKQHALLKKAHQADTALRIDNWVNAVELQPPK